MSNFPSFEKASQIKVLNNHPVLFSKFLVILFGEKKSQQGLPHVTWGSEAEMITGHKDKVIQVSFPGIGLKISSIV